MVLGDTEFIFASSNQYLTRSQCSLFSISIWTLEDKFHISVHPCIWKINMHTRYDTHQQLKLKQILFLCLDYI